MNLLQKFLCVMLLCLTETLIFADDSSFIGLPNTSNLFDGHDDFSNKNVGLWVTPIAPNERPTSQTTYQSIGGIQSSVGNVLSSTGPSQLLNNLFNSNILNQVGVGVKVNF